MKHKRTIMAGLLAGVLCISALLGMSIKESLDPIYANKEYSIVLNKDNGQVTDFAKNHEEKIVTAKTTNTLRDVRFGYIECSKGNSNKNLVNISTQGSFYNLDAITNISNITVTGVTEDEYAPITIYDGNRNMVVEDMLVFNNGVATLTVASDTAYYFKIETEMHSLLIENMTISYLCGSTLDGKLTTYSFDKNNAHVTNKEPTQTFTANGKDFTFYTQGLEESEGNIANFTDYAYFVNAEPLTNLARVCVNVSGSGMLYTGSYAYENSHMYELNTGYNYIDIKNGQEYIDIKSSSDKMPLTVISISLLITSK